MINLTKVIEESKNQEFQSSGDDYIDELVDDLEIMCGFSIDPSIFRI